MIGRGMTKEKHVQLRNTGFYLANVTSDNSKLKEETSLYAIAVRCGTLVKKILTSSDI
jgi:hypothetical protein